MLVILQLYYSINIIVLTLINILKSIFICLQEKKVLRKSSRDVKDFHLIYNRYFVYFVFFIEVF